MIDDFRLFFDFFVLHKLEMSYRKVREIFDFTKIGKIKVLNFQDFHFGVNLILNFSDFVLILDFNFNYFAVIQFSYQDFPHLCVFPKFEVE